MATFIHIFAEEDRKKILHNGIKVAKTGWRKIDGVFLSPVTEDHTQTHQWMREVQRIRNVPKLAARIRIPNDESVYIGKYNEEHIAVSAAEVIAIAREHQNPWGLEMIVSRAVRAAEVIKIYRLPKVVGWRRHPNSKGTKPCGCSYCQRGEPGAKKLRAMYERDIYQLVANGCSQRLREVRTFPFQIVASSLKNDSRS